MEKQYIHMFKAPFHLNSIILGEVLLQQNSEGTNFLHSYVYNVVEMNEGNRVHIDVFEKFS